METKNTRRSFLKTAAAAAASGALSGPAIFADGVMPSTKLNIGMIGVGGKGATNVALFAPLKVNLVAICDVDMKNAEGVWSTSKANKYHDYREMLEKETTLDAVIVSTPDHHHGPASIMAMKLGRHVYCEKPMAHSIYEARRMAEVAREMKVATQMGNQGHAGRILRRAVEIVQSGAIGKVREFHAWTDRPSWAQGMDAVPAGQPVPETLDWDLWLGQAAPREYNEAYLPRIWRGWYDFGTGSLGDMGCHVMDLGFWALKLGTPTTIEAQNSGATPFSPPKAGTIKYEFPERGDLPPVTLTWYDGGRKPDPKLVGLTELPSNGSILVGDEGTLYVPETYGAKYQLLPEEKFKDFGIEFTFPVPASHYAEWQTAAKGGAPAMSEFPGYGAILTESVLLGNLAMRVGKKITWDHENMKAVGCPEADAFIKPVMREGWKV